MSFVKGHPKIGGLKTAADSFLVADHYKSVKCSCGRGFQVVWHTYSKTPYLRKKYGSQLPENEKEPNTDNFVCFVCKEEFENRGNHC